MKTEENDNPMLGIVYKTGLEGLVISIISTTVELPERQQNNTRLFL